MVTSGPLIFNSNCVTINKLHLLAMMDQDLSLYPSPSSSSSRVPHIPTDADAAPAPTVPSSLLQFAVPKQQLCLKVKIPRSKQKFIAENGTSIGNVLLIQVASHRWYPLDTDDALRHVQQCLLNISGLENTQSHDDRDHDGDNAMYLHRRNGSLNNGNLIWYLVKSTIRGYRPPTTGGANHDQDLFM